MIDVLDIEHQMQKSDHGIDLLARVKVSGRQHALVCGVGASGQPRHVRVALLQLRDYVANQAKDAVPVFIAPYLSPEAQALCREQGVGYLDMEGNARVSFGSEASFSESSATSASENVRPAKLSSAVSLG